MTVRLLTDYPPYRTGNLFTGDAGTESGLLAQRIATTNLTGGTTYVAPEGGHLDIPPLGPVFTCQGDNNVGATKTVVMEQGWAATSYQWMRNGVAVAGATAARYTLVSADLGCLVSCRVGGLTDSDLGQPISGA